MAEVWTIRRVLAWATEDFQKRGLVSPRLDAEVLAAHALGVSRVSLYMDLDRPLTETERGALRALIERRRAREPVAYIVGARDFYKHRFQVAPGVLVPRPETETLVEEALRLLPREGARSALDLGVGSGAIGLSLLAERPELEVVGVDVSREALSVAAENAATLGLEARYALREGDLFSAVREDERFDVIVSNPPYIPSAQIETLDEDVRGYEPRLALDGGADGLDFYRRIGREAPLYLAKGGALLVEVGDGQAAEVEALFRDLGAYMSTRVMADLGGTPRVVIALAG